MEQVSVQDAKTHLSSLLDRVLKGETIVVCRHNRPVAELRPLAAEPVAVTRIIGFLDGKVNWDDVDFSPMSEEELADWDNSEIFPVDKVIAK